MASAFLIKILRHRKFRKNVSHSLTFYRGCAIIYLTNQLLCEVPNYEAFHSRINLEMGPDEENGDVVSDALYNRGPQYAKDGVFANLVDAPYLDYSQPWWNDKYMSDISVGESERYLLQGDISVFSLHNLSAMFYNNCNGYLRII